MRASIEALVPRWTIRQVPCFAEDWKEVSQGEAQSDREEAQEERVGADDDDSGGAGVILGGCCCCCCLVIAIVLLCSLKGLSALSYGLTRNTFSGAVNLDYTYHGGRHMIGTWNEFIEFPATLQLLAWTETGAQDPFLARTREGNMVTLAVTVQYMLAPDKVPSLYSEYKDKVENFLVSYIKSAFQEVVSQFTVEELWQKRMDVALALKTQCDTTMANPDKLKGYTTCWGVQLHDVTLDPTIEKRIEDRQVQEQTQASEQNKQHAAKIRAQTQVNESRFDLIIQVVNATAEASATQIREEANSNAAFNSKAAQATTLLYAKEHLKAGSTMMSSAQLNTYFYNVAAMTSKGAKIVYGDFAAQTVTEL